MVLGLGAWPERAPSRQSGIGGVKGHNTNETSSPGSPALWAGSFTIEFVEVWSECRIMSQWNLAEEVKDRRLKRIADGE
jgi:hypothetical protein